MANSKSQHHLGTGNEKEFINGLNDSKIKEISHVYNNSLIT